MKKKASGVKLQTDIRMWQNEKLKMKPYDQCSEKKENHSRQNDLKAYSTLFWKARKAMRRPDEPEGERRERSP